MARKLVNLPSVEELTKSVPVEQEVHEEEQEEVITSIPEDEVDYTEDVEQPSIPEEYDYSDSEEYQEPAIAEPVVQPRTEYTEEEEAEALEEVIRERENKKKKKPRKLKKGVIIGIVSAVGLIIVCILGYFVVKKMTQRQPEVITEQKEEPKKQDFTNFERMVLKQPTVAEQPEPTADTTNTKSGQEIVQSYKLEYPYVDLTLKEDADGQFVLIYNKNDKQVLCYSEENQFVAGTEKRVAIGCEIDEDMSNEKPISYMFRESD